MGLSRGGRMSSLPSFGRDAGPSQEGVGLLQWVGAVCTPANLLVCSVVALGWFALIGWTGAGPEGWQARLCADLDLQPRACAAVTNTTGTSS
ncbi:hypothetical protein [Methylorubrum zatmanii]|uniref:Uncharacterized protein n=1 Tax=Methylorubrum zatmanii TaxID=29429 RepID=A0ABW1WI04_9HYPH|nr:hypothetical protein [Methylorubrum zatmanii]MBD8906255.1 hypothetical protein [Methylorubrum zatmanii]